MPLTLLIVATAMPIAIALNPANPSAHCDRADVINATSHMLVVFAPQVIFYGISVVLYGLLQAYRRFAGPTLGPAISSLVVITACLAFVPLSDGQPLGSLPVSAELVLSVGTTLGIAALAVVGIVPTWRLHLRFRRPGGFRREWRAGRAAWRRRRSCRERSCPGPSRSGPARTCRPRCSRSRRTGRPRRIQPVS